MDGLGGFLPELLDELAQFLERHPLRWVVGHVEGGLPLPFLRLFAGPQIWPFFLRSPRARFE